MLITGETGTGKELFARGVHQRSRRRTKPFVEINWPCPVSATGRRRSRTPCRLAPRRGVVRWDEVRPPREDFARADEAVRKRLTDLVDELVRAAGAEEAFRQYRPRSLAGAAVSLARVMRSASVTEKRDCAQYSRFPGLDGLEVMAARWVEHSFAPHMHDFYAVSLNYQGRGAFDCRHEVHEAAPGTCNLIAPGELHTGRATSRDGWTYRNLHVEAPLMTRLLHNIDWKGPADVSFKSSLVSDSVLSTRLARVFASMSESSSLLEIESLLLTVMARLITNHIVQGHALRPAGREHAAITRTRAWLDANSEQNVSIRSLADLAGLSPYYLVRAFHRQVGVPPHRYQTILRVNCARKLLASGVALSDVAYRTGFCDQSHLTRCFKSTLGVTPGIYSRVMSKDGVLQSIVLATSRMTSRRQSTSDRRSR